jgi:hypothetical protein
MTRKLTADDAEMIKVLGSIAKVSALAKEYDVNPATIYNVLNGVSHSKPIKARSDRTLGDDTVREIKRLNAQGLSDWKISKQPGMPSRSTVRQIVNGVTYRNIV